MAEGDSAAQGDLLADQNGGAAAAADGATKGSDTKADAGKAAALAAQDKGGDAGKAAADLKVAADAEAARVAALTPEQKAAADKKGADDKGKEGEPVDYAKTLADAVPDGMKLDDAAAKPFIDAFAKHKLSPEAVKDLAALQAAANKASADGAAKAFSDAVDVWKKESTADKDLGAENLGLAKATAGKVFDTKTIELMEHFGLMNHPGVLKGLVKIGKATKDDSFVPGDAGGSGSGNDARKSFPNSNMNP